jgi:hypothetical protein
MSLLANSLVSLFILISFLFFYILVLLQTTSMHNTTDTMNLIQLPGVSLSTSNLGNRILEYSDESNSVYMTIDKDTYAGFVYVK